MGKTTLNAQVDVTALYFAKSKGSLKSFPKRIEYEGHTHTFVESGLQMLVQTANGLVKFFEMTDGQNNYRLRQDQSHGWTLLSISELTNPLFL